MKTLTYFLLLNLLATVAAAQNPYPSGAVTDPQTGERLLVGEIPRETLEAFGIGGYDRKIHDEYRPNADTVAMLMELMDGLQVTVVAATWCPDSRLEVPRFLRVLDAMDGFGGYRILCVDRNKQAGGVVPLKIERVPTFILYFNGTEVGRIVEKPRQTFETDMYTLLRQR